MNSSLSNFSDETGERFLEVGKAIKKQIVAKPIDANDKKDPVTGKPVISKKLLTHLNLQVAQLAQMRIKKVREELEKQRLKVSSQQRADSGRARPEVKQKEGVIGKVLKASKSTGEFGKNIGG